VTSPPAAVIFDLDGCLVDSEVMALSAIAAEMQDMGFDDVTFESIRARFLGVSMRVIFDLVTNPDSGDFPDDFVDRVEARLFEDYRQHLRQIQGVDAMLTALSERGIKVALATGGSVRRMHTTLSLGGLGPWFDGVAFSADQVAHGKPAPDLFLFAAQRLGVAAADCVVLEDSPHGIQGAVAAGMRAIGFVGGSHLDGLRETHAALLMSKGAAEVAFDMPSAARAFLNHGAGLGGHDQ